MLVKCFQKYFFKPTSCVFYIIDTSTVELLFVLIWRDVAESQLTLPTSGENCGKFETMPATDKFTYIAAWS